MKSPTQVLAELKQRCEAIVESPEYKAKIESLARAMLELQKCGHTIVSDPWVAHQLQEQGYHALDINEFVNPK